LHRKSLQVLPHSRSLMTDEEHPDGAAMEGLEDLSDDVDVKETPELPEGVTKEVITHAPDGTWKKPKAGDEVTVHYVGTLEADGSEFDSSRGRDQPFKFTLGQGDVIKGWDLGVATMKKGEVARFTLAPSFAYGTEGSPPKIPADAVLVFEVELLDFISKDDLFQDGGVIKALLKEGSGWKKPSAGEEVRMSLRSTSKDETVIEDKPELEYVLGSEVLGDVSKVLDKALCGMKKGEEAQLTCSKDYAYGEQYPDGVVLNVTLHQIYETRDVSFAKDKSLMKKQIVEGEGYETPKDTFKVSLKVDAAIDGSGATLPGFESKTLEFALGNGEVCDGIELAVADMKKGERARVTSSVAAMCREDQVGLKDISAETVVLEMELVDFEKAKDTWNMTEEEKVQFATERKEVGSKLFKQGRIVLALQRYKKVIDMFGYIENFAEENKAKAKALKKVCDLNQAACQLKLKNWTAAKSCCNNVLKEEPDSVKALFRRAQAVFELKDFMECMKDLKKVIELDPQNREARKLLKDAQGLQKEEDKKSKGMFTKMCQGLGKGPLPETAHDAEGGAGPLPPPEEPRASSSSPAAAEARTAAASAAAGAAASTEQRVERRTEAKPFSVFGLPGLIWCGLGEVWSRFWRMLKLPAKAIGFSR